MLSFRFLSRLFLCNPATLKCSLELQHIAYLLFFVKHYAIRSLVPESPFQLFLPVLHPSHLHLQWCLGFILSHSRPQVFLDALIGILLPFPSKPKVFSVPNVVKSLALI